MHLNKINIVSFVNIKHNEPLFTMLHSHSTYAASVSHGQYFDLLERQAQSLERP